MSNIRLHKRDYREALDQLAEILGAAVPNPKSDYGQDYGPLSPEQLAKLDRALSPAEQKAVEDWQAQQSDAALAAERAKGGPQSATVSVTEKGAVIKSLAQPSRSVLSPPWVGPFGLNWWQALLLGLGVVVTGTGLVWAFSGPKPRTLVPGRAR